MKNKNSLLKRSVSSIDLIALLLFWVIFLYSASFGFRYLVGYVVFIIFASLVLSKPHSKEEIKS